MTAATLDGVLVVDKPDGLTSHDVVAAARRALSAGTRQRRSSGQQWRVGHTGTLDPLATGVLPLACGRATRLVRFLIGSDKDYDATIVFGLSTDTCDITGTETARSDRRPDDDALARALASLTGSYLQIPPAYSAKKVAGDRAYDLARRDQKVELTPVPVTVSRATLTGFDGNRAHVSLTCSAGFYVRSFAHSLGELVGTGACLESLRRTRSGQFTIADAVPLAEVIENPERAVERLVPLDGLLAAFPAVRLTQEERVRVAHGRQLDECARREGLDAAGGEAGVCAKVGSLGEPTGQRLPGGPPDRRTALATAEWVRLVDGEGHLVAIATPGKQPGSLHPAVVLI